RHTHRSSQLHSLLSLHPSTERSKCLILLLPILLLFLFLLFSCTCQGSSATAV
ncbi:unnamed protein product, partial [Closterium sp. NIES-53]